MPAVSSLGAMTAPRFSSRLRLPVPARRGRMLDPQRHEEYVQPAVSPELIASHGLTTDEYQKIVKTLRREPNFTELGVFSVIAPEHCSYKSSRYYLKHLAPEGPFVLHGPVDFAGVVDIGGGLAVAFSLEGHN